MTPIGMDDSGMERSLQERTRAGVPDCVLLEDYTSEAAFILNLKKRFKENLIYTYIGQVLLSVNPYKPLPIYTPETIQAYQNIHFFEAAPHVYALTDTAYRSLIEEHREQCILISGESGSGKTEASKKVLQFVAEASQLSSRAGDHAHAVSHRLLQSNPVLEAFGNAKTNHNDNSSRFGKYMDIVFNFLGEPVGGNILNYLLEKSRVVHQNKGERNFHVFYQLLSGADDVLLSTLQLKRNLEQYTYLSHPDVSTIDLEDKRHYEEVRRAMDVMELSAREQEQMYQIVASVMHLGNTGFIEEEGRAMLTNSNAVKIVSQLLGCNEEELSHALTHRTIEARDDRVTTPLNREQAVYARDALAKAVYDRMFSWLVSRLNTSLQPHSGDGSCCVVMGILDIYGFEIFQTNSFEQFCINYCNEKLQQLFIELTLKSEQEEYLKEGIEWEPVTYFNNKIICDLIEEKHKGIISILDEECLRPGETTDNSFLCKMTDKLKNHQHFISHQKADKKVQKTMEREEFKLMHYAGEVTYSIHGFLDKNNDLLFRDLRLVMSRTQNLITKKVFPLSELSSKKRPETTITQFKNSLSQLMVILSSKEPSYIRCIKPNDCKSAGVFDDKIVSHQVKYLGLMENLRVRRAGFAYRRQYKNFLSRYKSLCHATWPHYQGDARDGVQVLVDALGYQPDDYRMGNSKIFIRYAKTLFETEDAFQERKHQLVARIQARWRGFVERRRYLRQRQAAIVAQSWVRRYLAQLQSQRRRHAVTVIRNFIKGFITRSEAETELNYRFIQIARKKFLLKLAQSLPSSLLINTWPACPTVCKDASQELRRMHKSWLSRRYRSALTPEFKHQLELKVLAESLFKGKKKSYAVSVGPWFVNDRLTTEGHRHMRDHFQSNLTAGETLLYSSPVHKFDRHGYKKRDRILLLTSAMLSLVVEDGKHFKAKHRLPLQALTKMEVTSESDRFILLRLSPEQQKTDKGDLILEMPSIVEFVTLVVSTTKNPDLLNINTTENGQITHMLSDGTEGKIGLATGQNGPTITKSKSGHLIVVG